MDRDPHRKFKLKFDTLIKQERIASKFYRYFNGRYFEELASSTSSNVGRNVKRVPHTDDIRPKKTGRFYATEISRKSDKKKMIV